MATASASGARLVLRRALAAVLLVLLALVAWTAWALLASRGALQHTRSALTAPAPDATATDTARRLAEARRELQQVDDRLSAPGPALTSRLPWLGRTPRAVQVATRAALAAVVSGERVLAATSDGPPLVSNGQVDPQRLAALAKALRRSARDLAGPVGELRDVRIGLTPGEVGRGVTETRERLDDASDRFASAADALDALAAVTGAEGPRRLLLVLENNAELRGTGGIISVFAEATAVDGRVQLRPFRDVDDVADPLRKVTRVASPADYHRLWGPYLADSTLWKNVNMSPDVATSSTVLAAIARTSLHRSPDAIVWLDVRTLADIIGATSPARLPDGTVLTKSSTVPALLSGAYRAAVDSREGQAERRARLRAAADAVAGRLLHGRPDAARLSLALAGAARGRHLAIWSAHPREQAAFAAAGVAGDVRANRRADGADIVSAVVQNFGGGDRDGNKLDFYARRLVTVRVRLSRDTAEVEQEVSLRNTAPLRGLPAYVGGRVNPGTSNNFLTLAVPAGAQLLSFTRGGSPVRTEALPEGDHRVVSDALSLPPGTTATWRLRYRLRLPASGVYTLQAVPQPLAVDAGLHVEITGDRMQLQTAAGRVGDIRISEPFDEERTVTAQPADQSVLRRAIDGVRRFWNEPVRLPF